MNLIKPKKLKNGDTIAIIAPSGPVDFDKVINGKNYFESLGYKVKLGSNIQKSDRYLAGTDKERLEDLHWAFSDPEIDCIICARGGYGAIRLIDKIDYNLIKKNPKIFCGYSDITALSAMFLKNSGLITFSSPMVKGDFQPENLDKFTISNFWKTLFNNEITIIPNEPEFYNKKDAQGLIFGGNLATITSLCGIDFIPDEKFLFFAEDLNEPVYKIDKYFRQLINIKKFKKNISALILGDFLDVDNDEYLEKLFCEIAQELNIPVIKNYPISHSKKKATIPIGGKGIIKNGVIQISYR